MQLNEAILHGAVSCTVDMPLQEVAMLMKANDVGAVVVVDEGQRPIGMVTDRDIALREVAEAGSSLDPGTGMATVQSVMTGSLKAVSEDRDLFEVVEEMSDSEVRRLPVVDNEGKLIGLVSMGDVLKALVHSLTRLVEGIAPQSKKIPSAA